MFNIKNRKKSFDMEKYSNPKENQAPQETRAPGQEGLKPKQIHYPALLGFAYRYKTPNGHWVLKFRLFRILAFLASVLLALWFAKSAGIYYFYKYNRDYDEMKFSDAFIFPANRAKHTVALGEYNIRKAKELFAQGQGRKGWETLMAGVARSPRNVEGKMLVARAFIQNNMTDQALDMLKSLLPYAYEDLNYMRLYTQLLLMRMDDETLIQVCKNILEREPKSPEVKAYLAMALATVYSMHGQYDKSKEYITKYGLDKTTPGILRLSKNEWEQGNREEAIETIAKNINQMQDLDPVYALLSNYYILLGDYSKVRQYATLRMLEKPLDIAPRIDYLRAIANSGEKEKSQEELYKLYEANKNDEGALLSIAHYATETGELDLMRKIYDTSIRNNFKTEQFCMMLLETFISCKKYQEAVDFSEAIIKEKPKWLKKSEDVFMCLRAVAYYAIGDLNLSGALVDEVVKRKSINPRNMVATARRFALLGENSMAHKMYLSAVQRDPKHQYALVRLIQFEIDSGNSSDLGKYILRLINLRRPPRDMILRARTALVSDRFIYTTDREKVINAIDAIFDIERVSNNRILSDMPSDYEDEKVFTSF